MAGRRLPAWSRLVNARPAAGRPLFSASPKSMSPAAQRALGQRPSAPLVRTPSGDADEQLSRHVTCKDKVLHREIWWRAAIKMCDNSRREFEAAAGKSTTID